MEKMIAACGLTCTECPANIATKNQDTDALEALARIWSEQYGAALSADDCTCNGCHSRVGPWMSHCTECGIRACGTEKGVENCAECAEYACDKLVKFLEFGSEAKATLDRLRGES